MIDDMEIREELEKSKRQLDLAVKLGLLPENYHLALAVAELHDAVRLLAYRVCGTVAPPATPATPAGTPEATAKYWDVSPQWDAAAGGNFPLATPAPTAGTAEQRRPTPAEWIDALPTDDTADDGEPMTEARLAAISQYFNCGTITRRGALALIREVRRLWDSRALAEQVRGMRPYDHDQSWRGPSPYDAWCHGFNTARESAARLVAGEQKPEGETK